MCMCVDIYYLASDRGESIANPNLSSLFGITYSKEMGSIVQQSTIQSNGKNYSNRLMKRKRMIVRVIIQDRNT